MNPLRESNKNYFSKHLTVTTQRLFFLSGCHSNQLAKNYQNYQNPKLCRNETYSTYNKTNLRPFRRFDLRYFLFLQQLYFCNEFATLIKGNT